MRPDGELLAALALAPCQLSSLYSSCKNDALPGKGEEICLPLKEVRETLAVAQTRGRPAKPSLALSVEQKQPPGQVKIPRR